MGKETYKDFVYFKMPKSVFEELIKKAEEEGKDKALLNFYQLSAYKHLYEEDIQSKQKSAKEAHRRKKAILDMKIYKALENYYTGLFRGDLKHINYSSLAKIANVNYRTAKRFFEEYNLSYWLKEFEKKGSKALREFLYQQLAESLVYSR